MEKEVYRSIVKHIINTELKGSSHSLLYSQLSSLDSVSQKYSPVGVIISFTGRISENRLALGSDTFMYLGEKKELCGLVLYINKDNMQIEALECFLYDGAWDLNSEEDITFII